MTLKSGDMICCYPHFSLLNIINIFHTLLLVKNMYKRTSISAPQTELDNIPDDCGHSVNVHIRSPCKEVSSIRHQPAIGENSIIVANKESESSPKTTTTKKLN